MYKQYLIFFNSIIIFFIFPYYCYFFYIFYFIISFSIIFSIIILYFLHENFFFILIISIAPFSRKITSYKKQIDVTRMRIRVAHKSARTCINRARKNVRSGTSGTETDRIRKQLRRVLCIIRSRNMSSPFTAIRTIVNEALTYTSLTCTDVYD